MDLRLILSFELQALRSLVREENPPLLSPEASFEQLFRQSRKEGLHGIALSALVDTYPEAGIAIKNEFLVTCGYRSLALRLGEQFAQRRISAVIFKGGALMWSAYPKAWMRPVSDLDFLVYEEQWPDIQKLCLELGFVARTDCGSGFYSDDGYAIDMHFSPLNQLELGYPIPRDLFWSETRDFTEFPGLLQFSPEMELLVVTLHGLKHSFARLIWLADTALLLSRIEPAKMDILAHRVGAVRAFVYLDYLLESILGLHFPHQGAGKPRLSWWEQQHLNRIVGRKATPWLGMLLPLFCVTTIRQRLGYLRHLLAPSQLTLKEKWKRFVRLAFDFLRDLQSK